MIMVLSIALVRSEEVYVCTGASSKCYHKELVCFGLKGCNKAIEKMDKKDAQSKGKRACKICYKKTGSKPRQKKGTTKKRRSEDPIIMEIPEIEKK